MKKTILLLSCTGWAIFSGLTANAQELSKPSAANTVRETPKKPDPQKAIKEDQNKSAVLQRELPGNKPLSPETNIDPGDSKIKPVPVAEKKSIKTGSTQATDIPNTILPKPGFTDMAPKINTTPPEKTQARSAKVAEQPKQN
jgi:hypothetical protein